jgi:hypothetical protein
LNIFRKNTYIIRRFKEQKIVNGYAKNEYVDIRMNLNVQPFGPEDLQSLPEGERKTQRVKAFSLYPLRAVDQATEKPGDWLWHDGKWYECKSSVLWDHTPLHHYRAEFVVIVDTEAGVHAPLPKVSDAP